MLNGTTNKVDKEIPTKLKPKYRPRLLGGAISAISKVENARNAACGMPLNHRNQYNMSALVAKEVSKLPKKHHTLSKVKMRGLDQLRNAMAIMGAAIKPPQR